MGCRLPDRLQEEAKGPIHVLVPRTANRPRRALMVVHQAATVRAWKQRGGVRLAHPAECWLQLVAALTPATTWRIALDAALVPEAWRSCRGIRPGAAVPGGDARVGFFTDPAKAAFLERIQVADGILDRKNPLISHDEFVRVLDRAGTSKGVAAARVYFSHARAGTDSLMETWLRLLVVDAGFPCPEVNRAIRDQYGQIRRYLDLSWPALRIYLEYQGKQHETDAVQVSGDMDRRGELGLVGWQLVEARHKDLLSPAALIARVHAAFAFAQIRP
jgi:hypothetical protein